MTSSDTIKRPTTVPAASRAQSFVERFSGLDGLRAIAVITVMLFHLTPGAAVGGYLGVDIFFVISGFLITGLLVREREAGGIRFRHFWVRRARRLLPALILMLLVCASAALVIGGDVLVGLRGQLFGAGTFSYNWLDIRRESSYFAGTTPELFRNLWSLAVEEQFYLVWPLVLAVVLFIRSTAVRVGFALLVAAASVTAMVMIFVPGGDSTRVYYGTDTHSFGLAIGAALALLVNARPTRTWSVPLQRIVTMLGVVAIPALLILAYVMSADAAIVYQGGLVLVAVLTAFAIAAAILPGSVLGRALDLAPLRWIGRRSYGLYLWHWPAFILLAAAIPALTIDDAGKWLLGGIALVVTLIASALSFRFLEQPILKHGFVRAIGGWWRGVGMTSKPRLRRAVASIVVIALVGLTVTTIVTAPHQSQLEASIQANQAAVARSAVPEQPAAPNQPVVPPPPLVANQLPTGDQITAIGDSVMLAASPSLAKAFPGIDIHAVVSRQMSKGPGLMRSLAKKGKLRPVVLIALGTNGPIEQSDLDSMLTIAGGPAALVVLVNVQAPRGWTKDVNAMLTAFAATHQNVELADWRGGIHDHIDDYLYDDHIHPKDEHGGKIYVTAVTEAMQRLVSAVQPGAPPQ